MPDFLLKNLGCTPSAPVVYLSPKLEPIPGSDCTFASGEQGEAYTFETTAQRETYRPLLTVDGAHKVVTGKTFLIQLTGVLEPSGAVFNPSPEWVANTLHGTVDGS